jgi:nucleoid-associated protein YgaU
MPPPTVMGAAGAGSRTATRQNPKLEYACLEIRTPPPGGTRATPGPVADRVEFQFNPKELTLTKTAKWKRESERSAKKSGAPQFLGAEPAKLSLEMFLDASRRMDDSVVRRVEKLFSCCVPTDATRDQQKASPPWVVFRWGALTGFPAHVTTVSVRYTLFTPGGLPVRAVCTISLEEMGGEVGGQNPTSGSLSAHTAHTLEPGDSLAGLAHRSYGDPTRWRAIAEANGIDDPMRLPVGRPLLVPSLEELSDGEGPR